MRLEPEQINWEARKDERGAALITVLLISTLLMAAGSALILVTTTASRTAVDATAEMQAYYSAEAGLQSTLNVLRGNIAAGAGMPAGTKINFRNAINLSTANSSGDSGPSCLANNPTSACRLSGWLTYDYTSSGSSNPDRVTLTPSYTATTGLAFSVTVSDPDLTPIANGEPTRLLLRVTGY